MAAPSGVVPWQGGTLVYAGGTAWATMGRSGGGKKKDPVADAEQEALFPNLPQPTRLKTLANVRIMFVAGGPAAVHCMAGDAEGRLYTWGRNEKGQLGHGDFINRNNPRIVEDMAGKFVVTGASGRHHSLVVTREGEAWSWGLNQQGQLGMGSIKKGATKQQEDIQSKPVKTPLEQAVACSAGVDFSMWIAGGGKLYSAGSPQYGQLGDGSDHAYNAKESSIAMVFEPMPTPKVIPSLRDKTITRVACGHNHTIAVDNESTCYTWGSGGYGRLGHRVQKDEFAPKKIEDFKGRLLVPADAIIAAGSTSTFCTIAMGGTIQQLYSWGKLKISGDNLMYPVPDANMTGWNVRSIACGPQHFAIAADQSAITWGFATNGELAYGPEGKKSSANAAKVEALDGITTHQVACGLGFTMFLVDPNAPKVADLPEFESTAPETTTVDIGAGDDGGTGAAPVKGGKRGPKAAAAEAAPAAKKGRKK